VASGRFFHQNFLGISARMTFVFPTRGGQLVTDLNPAPSTNGKFAAEQTPRSI
jgi:hypothetical protein